MRFRYLIGFVLGAFLLAGISVSASTTCTGSFFGGTGICYPNTWTSGAIPFGNGNSGLATSTGLTFTSATNNFATTYASTTAVSGTTICISTDCRTVWPSGGGSDPFTHPAAGISATTSEMDTTGGIVVNAASSTFAVNADSATTTFNQSVIFQPSGNFSASESVGGPFRVNCSGANTCAHFFSSNTSGGVLVDIDQTGTTNTTQAFRIESSATNQSAFNIQCAASGLGCGKFSPTADQGANGSLVSWDASVNSDTGMGEFGKMNASGAGLSINDYNSTNVFKVAANGATGINASSPTDALDVGTAFSVSTTTGNVQVATTTGGCLQIGAYCLNNLSFNPGLSHTKFLATSTTNAQQGKTVVYTIPAGVYVQSQGLVVVNNTGASVSFQCSIRSGGVDYVLDSVFSVNNNSQTTRCQSGAIILAPGDSLVASSSASGLTYYGRFDVIDATGLNAGLIVATTTISNANTLVNLYTVPAGKNSLSQAGFNFGNTSGPTCVNQTAVTLTLGEYYTPSGGVPILIGASTTATSDGGTFAPIASALNSSDSIGYMDSTAAPSLFCWGTFNVLNN